MRQVVWRSALLGIGAAGLCAQAGAASFDCSKARSPREKVICADPELSDADLEVDRLYKAAMAQLSQGGGKRLQEGQRGWLRFLGQICLQPGGKNHTEASGQCLLDAYRERIADLQHAAVQSGPFLFTQVDRYSVTRLRGGNRDGSGLVMHHLANPLIDRPATVVTQRWNQLAAPPYYGSMCDSGQGDVTIAYTLGLVTSRLLSVTWSDSQYCQGNAHGSATFKAQTIALLPAPHPMQATDLFRADTPWKESLVGLLSTAVERAAAAEGRGSLDSLAYEAIAAAAALPGRWSLRSDGFHLMFNSYELGSYAFAPDVAVPWSGLQGLLAIDPLAP